MKIHFKVMRFFNLLEPKNEDNFPILSISKLFMWAMLGTAIYVLVAMPANAATIIGAVGGVFASSANYAWRRHCHTRNVSNIRKPVRQENFD